MPTLGGDTPFARQAAGLERLAVETYEALLASASAGSLGTVPALVGAVVTTARVQHEEHLATWNARLRSAGEADMTEPDEGLKAVVDQILGEVTDVTGAARLALLVEEVLADTYLRAIPTLADPDAVRVASLMLVTDQQHQSVIRFALGEPPAPEAIQVPDRAAS